jgi:hypothetical protein
MGGMRRRMRAVEMEAPRFYEYFFRDIDPTLHYSLEIRSCRNKKKKCRTENAIFLNMYYPIFELLLLLNCRHLGRHLGRRLGTRDYLRYNTCERRKSKLCTRHLIFVSCLDL